MKVAEVINVQPLQDYINYFYHGNHTFNKHGQALILQLKAKNEDCMDFDLILFTLGNIHDITNMRHFLV